MQIGYMIEELGVTGKRLSTALDGLPAPQEAARFTGSTEAANAPFYTALAEAATGIRSETEAIYAELAALQSALIAAAKDLQRADEDAEQAARELRGVVESGAEQFELLDAQRRADQAEVSRLQARATAPNPSRTALG